MNANLREQIKVFKFHTKLTDEDIARRLRIHRATLKYKIDCPTKFTVLELYMLKILFEEHGRKFDMTLGEGEAAC